MSEMNLKDALQLMNQLDNDNFFSEENKEIYDHLIEYGSRLDESGANLMNKLHQNENVLSILSLLQCTVLIYLAISEEDIRELIKLQNSYLLSKYGALMMKLSIGLAALEEIR